MTESIASKHADTPDAFHPEEEVVPVQVVRDLEARLAESIEHEQKVVSNMYWTMQVCDQLVLAWFSSDPQKMIEAMAEYSRMKDGRRNEHA
jgi:hypothetical protein